MNATDIKLIFGLIVLFQLKHFLADYILQGKYHLGKFSPDWSFIGPLANHCSIHTLFTGVIVAWTGRWDLWWLPWIDFVCHFIMDRIKASPHLLGRFKALSGTEMRKIILTKQNFSDDPDYEDIIHEHGEQLLANTFFWWSLGLDQMIHHLTDAFIIYKLVTWNI